MSSLSERWRRAGSHDHTREAATSRPQGPVIEKGEMNVVRVDRQQRMLSQIAHSACSMMGIGQTMMALSSCVRKRDISALWELDPIAAPPPRVQMELLGTQAEQEDLRSDAHNDLDEERNVLELQLRFAMRRHDVVRVRAISRQLCCLEAY